MLLKYIRKGISFLPLFFLLLISSSFCPEGQVKIGLLKYQGGGDWYANLDTSLPNLIKFCNQQLGTHMDPIQGIVEPGSNEIFNYPFIHMTGHGNWQLTNAEANNLRKYLLAGGFLHISDNYGMDPFIRPQLKKIFPELSLVELPFSHPIYHQSFQFNSGLPKVHEHDGKAPQGFGLIYEDRLLVFYDFECDLGDGWEDAEVHRDSEAARINALKMGANLIQYAFNR
jgi:hypothetical protein